MTELHKNLKSLRRERKIDLEAIESNTCVLDPVNTTTCVDQCPAGYKRDGAGSCAQAGEDPVPG